VESQEWPDAATKARAAQLQLLVPWMHGSLHSKKCQHTHCGRFVQGAGRRVGENTEQLWSMVKVGGGGAWGTLMAESEDSNAERHMSNFVA